MSMAQNKTPLTPMPADASLQEGEAAGAEERDRIGEVLEKRYELIRKIGEGAMGEVYEGRHLQLGRVFAVKLLRRDLLGSKRMVQRFKREIRAASCIESLHVVSVVDCGHSGDGAPYYVMELLRGMSLRQLLAQQAPLSLPRVLRLGQQLCRGLQAAHSRGLVHRDLKPENVCIVNDDAGSELAKVLDFGLVRLDSAASLGGGASLVGTIRYMAPEQALDPLQVDARADIYAVGAILYEALTNRRPHPGDTAEEILFHTMNREPSPLQTLRPGLPASADAVLQRALARDPSQRFTSATDFASALERLSARSTETAATAPGDSRAQLAGETLDEDVDRAPPAPPLRFRQLALVALAGAGVVAVALSFVPTRARSQPARAVSASTSSATAGAAAPATSMAPVIVARSGGAAPASSAAPTVPPPLPTKPAKSEVTPQAPVRPRPSAHEDRRPAQPHQAQPLPSSRLPPTPPVWNSVFDVENPYLAKPRAGEP